MTITKKTIIPLIALGFAAISSVKAAPITVNQGDILLSFYQNLGTSAGPTTYIVNLGAGSDFFNNPGGFSLIANLNDELTSAFGAGWANDSTLKMGLVGGFQNGSSSAEDPARTLYMSKGLSTFAPGTTTAPSMADALHRTVATNLADTYLSAMNGVDDGGAEDGAIVPISVIGDYSQFNPPANSYFGSGININASFGAGVIGTGTGGYSVEAALDLYRMVYQGSTDYAGTFTIDSDGNLRFDAVPEPSTYALIAIAGLAWMFIRRRKNVTL